MGKNKFSEAQIQKLQNMNLNELLKALDTGTYSKSDMRKAYTQMRDIAVKRIKRLNTEANIRKYGKQNLYIENGEYFKKLKGITSDTELIKELREVSTFLKSSASTVTGQKAKKKKIMETIESEGGKISDSEYPKFLEFLKWFKSSEYAKKIGSTEAIVSEVFNSSQSGNPEGWRKAFDQYLKHGNRTAPVRQY